MSRKKKSTIVVDSEGRSWDPDDLDLDSFGVEAPQREVFALFAEKGYPPEEVNEEIRVKYTQYLERVKKKAKEREMAKKAEK